jgi:hypothetical protein
MDIEFPGFINDRRSGESATHPLARPAGRLAVSLLLAGMGLQRRRFAPAIHLDAPSGAPNYGF